MEIADSEQVIAPVVKVKVQSSHRAECPRCCIDYLRRKPRKGILQKVLYPIFGYYPWRCRVCKGSYIIRKRGFVA